MARFQPVLLAALLLVSPGAPAEVNRCELPTGDTVYTDRRCSAIGAAERKAPQAVTRVRGYRTACPRTVRDLLFEVSASIESQDVNRLASVYHWPGMSTRQGYSVMERLETVVERPLVGLQPVFPYTGSDDALYMHTMRSQPPVALRIEQVATNGRTPARAVFGLRRHLDCWWITGGAPAPAPADHAAARTAD